MNIIHGNQIAVVSAVTLRINFYTSILKGSLVLVFLAAYKRWTNVEVSEERLNF